MQITASGPVDAVARRRRLTARVDPPAVAAWTLAFATVAYLAFNNGGYDTIVRSQVGIAVWWIVLLGALAGVLPMRFGRAGWVAIGLLAGFTVWTGVAATWSESAERSMIELGRVATYLGVLVLTLCLQGRAVARHTIDGLASAIGLVTLLAVLSRLHPQWFPVNDQLEFLGPIASRKLSYPLNYWNALAAFVALGVPLLLGVALGVRTIAGRSLAAATLPLSGLCIYLTISRGGVLALIVGIVVFLAFVPNRLVTFGTLLVAGAGTAILISAASQRDAIQDAATTAAAVQQGTDLIWLVVIVCGGVALLQAAIALAERHLERPAVLAPGRRATAIGAVALVSVGCVLAVAAGVPSQIDDRWREFKAPIGSVAADDQDNVFSRLQLLNGTGRYQLWQAAWRANESRPWQGIGPGTFEFWWARDPAPGLFARDAHSLYFETLAETGIVGLGLLLGLFALLVVTAAARALRGPPAMRIWIAAAVGGLATFMTAAATEWVWEFGVIACVVMLLGVIILAGSDDAPVSARTAGGPRRARFPLAIIAGLAIGAVAVPMAGALATRESRAAAADDRLAAALTDVRTAERVQPYAASADLQRALVLERGGALANAATAATAATAKEPTNWRTWFVLARIEARRGHRARAVDALRTARRMNPRSPLVGRP
jgi:hypothetical protein